MNILHINTYDFGGAATACIRIHLELLRQGIDSNILLLRKSKEIPQTFQFIPERKSLSFTEKGINKINRLLIGRNRYPIKIFVPDFRLIDKSVEVFSFPYSNYDITESVLYKEADIIQINWASGFLNERTFFSKNNKPVVWRMPDLYPCGGGNHYEKNFPFKSFENYIQKNIKIRRDSLKRKNIYFVPISKWVEEKANESEIIGCFPKKIIHNGVDFNLFNTHNQMFARRVFNLEAGKTILLFGSENVRNKRKGFDILLDVLKELKLKNCQLVVFGKDPNKEDLNYKFIGEIKNDRLLSILYSAADYFIMPSIEEAFGQVTIESLSCGTPVISFPTGGSLDIIKDGTNGVLAQGFTHEDLKNAIVRGLSIKFNRERIVNEVHSKFNIVDKVKEYVKLYQSILEKQEV